MFSGLTSASLRTWVAGLQRELPHPACGQGVADTAPGEAAQPCQTTASVPSRPLCQPMGGSLRKIEHTYLTAHPDTCTVLLFCYSLNIRAQWSSVSTFRHLSLAECTFSSFLALKLRIYWEKYWNVLWYSVPVLFFQWPKDKKSTPRIFPVMILQGVCVLERYNFWAVIWRVDETDFSGCPQTLRFSILRFMT